MPTYPLAQQFATEDRHYVLQVNDALCLRNYQLPFAAHGCVYLYQWLRRPEDLLDAVTVQEALQDDGVLLVTWTFRSPGQFVLELVRQSLTDTCVVHPFQVVVRVA